MNFSDAIREEKNIVLTENGALALNSTGSPLVDLFGTVGAMRGQDSTRLISLFREALEEHELLAVKLMFYARNVRGGLGEREVFRTMLKWLAVNKPLDVLMNIELIPHFGRWDDLFALVDTPIEQNMWALISETLHVDHKNMRSNNSDNRNPVSLLAKWMPSINTSSKETRTLGRRAAVMLGMTEKQYRKVLSKLRSYINITEKKMSANEWKEIDYSSVPSIAMKNYRKAFGRHDSEGFGAYIESVSKGEEKINSSTLYPYDIMEAAGLTHYYGSSWSYGRGQAGMNLNLWDSVLEEQWKALPNYVQGENNVLVMADTSGSMEGRPMATAVGLAIYFAERNKGAYKDLFMTFSESPSFVELKGATLKDKVNCVPSIVANTDLQAAFDLILETAIKNNVSQEEMPKALVIISDMQFDAAQGWGFNQTTFFKEMKQNFKNHGYEMPLTIYWDVEARRNSFQGKAQDENIVFVSGQSASSFRDIISNIGRTPLSFMIETLSNPMYDVVKV